MEYFTVEISGKPIVAFRSEDRDSAEQLFEAEDFRDDLCVLESEGAPLWDGEAPLTLRSANDEERTEVDEAYDFDDDPDKSPEDELVVFLIDIVDPEDEDEDEDENGDTH